MLKRIVITLAALAGLVVLAVGGAIAFGGPKPPPAQFSLRAAAAQRDRSDMPALMHVAARDGTSLAYRSYAPDGPATGTAVLIHGSAGLGADMHEIARALSAAGIAATAPDLRGHGGSGPRGDIAYIGQLEDDLADLLDLLDRQNAPRPRILIGHSLGGAFALRVAASPLASRFVGSVLLAPALGQDALIEKRSEGGWFDVGRPRLLALTFLDRIGLHVLGGLPVLAFSLEPADIPVVTPSYSFRLAFNFGAHRNWRRDLRKARGPLVVIIGARDPLFHPDKFPGAFGDDPDARVEVLPGIDHMGLTGDRPALAAIVTAAKDLLGRR